MADTSSLSSQQLPFDTGQLEQIFAQLAKRPPVHVHDVLSGNINTIVKVECEGRLYGLRVRTQEQVYRYEPDLVKEVFVAELLKLSSQFRTDAGTAALFAELLTARCGRLWGGDARTTATRFHFADSPGHQRRQAIPGYLSRLAVAI